MRELVFCGELGYVPYVRSRKEWIWSAASTLVGLGSSYLGGKAASAAAEKSVKHQRQMEAKDDAWYNRNYYQDYVDTNAGQNLVRRAWKMYDKATNRVKGAAKVTGATAGEVQMAKDSANQSMGETIANIAATDQQRKERADAQHLQAQRQYAQMDMNREMQRAQNITNAAQAASNAMMSIGSAVDQASAKTTSLNGGSNNSEVVRSDGGNGPAVQINNMRSGYTKGPDGALYDKDGNVVGGWA